MCNSVENESQFPCSVYWRGEDQILASNQGQGKAAAHPT